MTTAPASVLVTRPGSRGKEQCAFLEDRGISAYYFPVLKIVAAILEENQRSAMLSHDILAFVSPNAVQYGLAGIDQSAIRAFTGIVCAPGQGTAAMLREAGFANVIAPAGQSNSEELLKLPQLENVANRSVLIIRGQDGRELLGNTLRTRGAKVDYLAVYRRERRVGDPRVLRAWLAQDLPVVVVPSRDAVNSLIGQLPDEMRVSVLEAIALVPGHRVAQSCRDLGWKGDCVIIDDPGNETVFEALNTM